MRTKTFPDDCYVAISFAGEAYDCFNSIIASMTGGYCAEVDGKCGEVDGKCGRISAPRSTTLGSWSSRWLRVPTTGGGSREPNRSRRSRAGPMAPA